MKERRQRFGIWIAVAATAVWLVWPRGGGVPRFESRLGFDTGLDVRKMAELVAANPKIAPRGWMRFRNPDHRRSFTARSETRIALRELRRIGMRSCVLLTASGYPWQSGVRDLPGAKGTLPLDLREAYARGEWLGERFGSDVDAWEIDNEPDLIYVKDNPENYVAYLKAMYLGLKRGAAGAHIGAGYKAHGYETEENKRRVADRRRWPVDKANPWNHEPSGRRFGSGPRVVMAALAFPPGPYFDALLDNDLLSYTDAFNFHYYGYQEDFPGVYRQFEAAIAEWQQRSAISHRLSGIGDGPRKLLPIYISEYGYGILSERSAKTSEGRVRQWEYFRELAAHMRNLRIEAPMAFLLSPYLEDEAREFGLTMRSKRPAERESSLEHEQGLPMQLRGSLAGSPSQVSSVLSAGGITYTLADFGANEAQPWMNDIGREFAGLEATPALAWLLHQPPIAEPRAWEVSVPAPSQVVIDFIAEQDMRQSKGSRGHFLTGIEGRWSTGRGTVFIYNFARQAISGVFRLEGHGPEPYEEYIKLKPGERREVSVRFAIDHETFRAVKWSGRFEVDGGRGAPSRLESYVYSSLSRFTQRTRTNLRHSAEASASNAAALDARTLAKGEAPLHPQGRWRVTKGLQVEERAETWRFTVTEFPSEIMRPAVAELPLPDGFLFAPFAMILGDVRLFPRRGESLRPHAEPRSEPENSGLGKETIGIYFRTRQGGLYATTMHFAASTEWLHFGQIAQNFTTVFYGRMHLPWRFLDNEPAALVLMFRPRLLPATYEIRGARIVELETKLPEKSR